MRALLSPNMQIRDTREMVEYINRSRGEATQSFPLRRIISTLSFCNDLKLEFI